MIDGKQNYIRDPKDRILKRQELEPAKSRERRSKMLEEKVMHAFKRITDICVDTVGDMPKNDLILIGETLGLSKDELEQNFPELYEASEIELEEGGLDQDEDDSLITEETEEKEKEE